MRAHAPSRPRRYTRSLALTAALALTSAVPRANAFCGFYVSGSSEGLYNHASRVALMRNGTRTVLTMSNDYNGPPQDFAMVVPVPVVLHRENVRTLPLDVFQHMDGLTAPRLVEYWEQDPCATPVRREFDFSDDTVEGSLVRPDGDVLRVRSAVRVEARFVAGEYDVVILAADESSALENWLHANGYNIPRGAAAVLAPYIREQWKFFVAKVAIDRIQRRPDGGARLSPLRFHYDSPEFRLPVRLGLLNAAGPQDLIVYVLHPTSRFEVANQRNVFIPTNLEVTDAVRTQFAGMYAQLFDATLASAGLPAVVTEYAWASSSCDPCPVPPLEDREIDTLGADVLFAPDASRATDVQPQRPPGFTLTRLHTRYDRNTLAEDLVFREAPAVAGGREVPGPNGQLEQGAQQNAAQNTFQARYILRHPWQGAIDCPNPRRGIWGARPNSSSNSVQPAVELASAPRDTLRLASVITTPVPGVDLSAKPPFEAVASASSRTTVGASAPATRRGCACSTPGSTAPRGAHGYLVGWLASLAVLFRRRAGAPRARAKSA